MCAGDEPPIHTHTREDETLYVLEGAITAYVGDQTIDVEAGSYAALPKNVPHGLTVRGEEVRLLVTLEPAGAEYFFVPRDDSDNDPAKFGLIIQAAPGHVGTRPQGRRRLSGVTAEVCVLAPRGPHVHRRSSWDGRVRRNATPSRNPGAGRLS